VSPYKKITDLDPDDPKVKQTNSPPFQ